MTCIKMGSEENHFNVSLIVTDKSQDSVHKPQLLKRMQSPSGIEPTGRSAYQPTALPLGHTGAHHLTLTYYIDYKST